jgi:hypothetical protein
MRLPFDTSTPDGQEQLAEFMLREAAIKYPDGSHPYEVDHVSAEYAHATMTYAMILCQNGKAASYKQAIEIACKKGGEFLLAHHAMMYANKQANQSE